MFLVIFPFTAVQAATVRLNQSSVTVFLVIFPTPIVNRTVLIVKTTNSFKVSVLKMSLVSAYSHEKHHTLAFKVSIYETSFIIIAIFKVENSVSPKLILFPLALVTIAVSIEY
jgi:hypothetical protein